MGELSYSCWEGTELRFEVGGLGVPLTASWGIPGVGFTVGAGVRVTLEHPGLWEGEGGAPCRGSRKRGAHKKGGGRGGAWTRRGDAWLAGLFGC